MPRLASPLLAASLALFVFLSPARAEDTPVLDKKSTPDLIAQAEEMRSKSPDALAKALAAFEGTTEEAADAVTFLVEYAVREPGRALRYVAIERAAELDDELAAAKFAELADGEDRDRTIFALEALGYIGDKPQFELVLSHVKSSDLLIASQAAQTYGRINGKKGASDLLEAALEGADDRVIDRAAWAVQDHSKKTSGVITKLQKAAKAAGQKDSMAVKAAAVRLEDAAIAPHKWPKKPGEATKLVLAAPAEVVLEAKTNKYRSLLEETMKYIAAELPAQDLLIRAGTKKIVMPSTVNGRYLDLELDAVEVPATYVGQSPQQLAYHIVRSASVLFRKRCGEPHQGERGWETAILDTYEVCEAGGLYDAGKGGLNRTRFVQSILKKRPWDGN